METVIQSVADPFLIFFLISPRFLLASGMNSAQLLCVLVYFFLVESSIQSPTTESFLDELFGKYGTTNDSMTTVKFKELVTAMGIGNPEENKEVRNALQLIENNFSLPTKTHVVHHAQSEIARKKHHARLLYVFRAVTRQKNSLSHFLSMVP